jgi:N-acetylglucosamine-6-sulfatase
LRGNRCKFIRYHGIWDVDEFYDLAQDPIEGRNLIFSQDHQSLIDKMRGRLFDLLERSKGMQISDAPGCF